jgi:hypothetical protein
MSSLLTCSEGDPTAFTTLTPTTQRLSESDVLQPALVSVPCLSYASTFHMESSDKNEMKATIIKTYEVFSIPDVRCSSSCKVAPRLCFG